MVRLAVGQTGGGMQQVWQQKLPFTFAHATAAAGAKPAWPNAGLGVCVPRQTRQAWRAKSGRRRVQTCVTGCNQAASCKEVGTLATSFLGLHTLSALPWVLAPLTHSHKAIPTIPTRDQLNLNRLPACLSESPSLCLSVCLSTCP